MTVSGDTIEVAVIGAGVVGLGQLGDVGVREAVRLRGSDDFIQLGILSARHQAEFPDGVDRALARRDRQGGST